MARGVSCMKRSAQVKKRLFDARRDADAILAQGANRLLLIEAILIVCVFVSLFVSLQSATALLLTALPESELFSSLLTAALSLVYLLLGVLFAAPVVLGLFRMAEQMQAGNSPVLMDLFYYLSSGERYRKGLRITRLASIKLLLAVLIVNTVNFLCPISWLCGLLTAAVIILLVVWMLIPYSKLNSHLKGEDKPMRPFGGVRLVLFFLPWLLLGLVSIGLLLVLDVFPRMLLTYFCDCNREENKL